MRPAPVDRQLDAPLDEFGRAVRCEREQEHLRTPKDDGRRKRDGDEDPAPDTEVRDPDEGVVQPADSVLDDPAFDAMVERDHLPTVTVTVCGASGSGLSVRWVVLSPAGRGLS